MLEKGTMQQQEQQPDRHRRFHAEHAHLGAPFGESTFELRQLTEEIHRRIVPGA